MAKWINYCQVGELKLPDYIARIVEEPQQAGPTLHDALRSYSAWLEQEYVDTAAGVTAWGRTQIRRVATLIARHPDRPLAELQLDGVEELFRFWRKRPPSRAKGGAEPITRESATNYIKTLKSFFKWLHRSDAYDWRRPDNFEDVKLRVDTIDGDRLAQLSTDDIFTMEELALLFRYASRWSGRFCC